MEVRSLVEKAEKRIGVEVKNIDQRADINFHTQGTFTVCMLQNKEDGKILGIGVSKCRLLSKDHIVSELWEEYDYDKKGNRINSRLVKDYEDIINGDKFDAERGMEIAFFRALRDYKSKISLNIPFKVGSVLQVK